MRRSIDGVSFLLALVVCSLAQAQTPGLPYIELTPRDLKFTESPAIPGVHTALMYGDPTKPGPFVYRGRFPAGYKTPPHAHLEDRTVTVISGTLYVGNGDVFDESKMHALPPGSFYTEPSGMNHFVWVKDGDVVVQIQGTGPVRVRFVEPAKR